MGERMKKRIRKEIDKNKSIKTKYKKSFGGIEINSDFECGSCAKITKINENNFFIKIYSDPTNFGSYNWYFCIKVKNELNRYKNIVLYAGNEYSKIKETFDKSPVPVFTSQNFSEWITLSNIWQNNSGVYKVKLNLAPSEIQYISNSIPKPYSHVSNWLKEIAYKNKKICHLGMVGESAQKREILLLSITEDTNESKKDRILITSGFHPAEPDTLATEAIINFLIGEDKFAKKIREKFIIDLIPQMNPDGFILGTNGCNANGINLYWDFRKEDHEKTPEAYYLWRWMLENPPILYIDFHCYVHQPYKDYKPYIKPYFDYNSSKVRRLVKKMNEELIKLSHGRSMKGYLTNLPTTLAYEATKEFNTITYTKYHLHLKHGVKKSKEIGLNVFKRLCTELIQFSKNIDNSNLTEKILNKPYGKVKKNYLYTIFRIIYRVIRNIKRSYYHFK